VTSPFSAKVIDNFSDSNGAVVSGNACAGPNCAKANVCGGLKRDLGVLLLP
jgi:hypothetical protein